MYHFVFVRYFPYINANISMKRPVICHVLVLSSSFWFRRYYSFNSASSLSLALRASLILSASICSAALFSTFALSLSLSGSLALLGLLSGSHVPFATWPKLDGLACRTWRISGERAVLKLGSGESLTSPDCCGGFNMDLIEERRFAFGSEFNEATSLSATLKGRL